MEKCLIRKEAHDKVREIKEADLLVGIPSFNSAHTIGQVVKTVREGLGRYFPDSRSVIVNCDGGSTDGTMDIVRNIALDPSQSDHLSRPGNSVSTIVTPCHGLPMKGNIFRTFFEIVDVLNIKACAVVDPHLKSITPEWVELLIKPLLVEGYQYVAPLYYRHKYDGTITKNIIYPLMRALYGKHGQRLRVFGRTRTVLSHKGYMGD